MKALVNFQPLSFNTSGEYFLIFGQCPVHSCQHSLLEWVTHKGAIIQLHEGVA